VTDPVVSGMGDRHGHEAGARRAQPRVACDIVPPRPRSHNDPIEAARRSRAALRSSRYFDSPRSIHRISPSGRSGTRSCTRSRCALKALLYGAKLPVVTLRRAGTPAMSSITTDLATVLSTVRRPGDFCLRHDRASSAAAGGRRGVGPVALPCCRCRLSNFVAVASALWPRRETLAHGGPATWQIGADRVRIEGKHWARTLETILARVADGLGSARR
jgi:hypothetical protein